MFELRRILKRWRLRRQLRKLRADAINVMTRQQLHDWLRAEYPELPDILSTSFLDRTVNDR